jgi:hypothetical protein
MGFRDIVAGLSLLLLRRRPLDKTAKSKRRGHGGWHHRHHRLLLRRALLRVRLTSGPANVSEYKRKFLWCESRLQLSYRRRVAEQRCSRSRISPHRRLYLPSLFPSSTAPV